MWVHAYTQGERDTHTETQRYRDRDRQRETETARQPDRQTHTQIQSSTKEGEEKEGAKGGKERQQSEKEGKYIIWEMYNLGTQLPFGNTCKVTERTQLSLVTRLFVVLLDCFGLDPGILTLLSFQEQ